MVFNGCGIKINSVVICMFAKKTKMRWYENGNFKNYLCKKPITYPSMCTQL